MAIKQILTQPSLPPGEKDIVRARASREARNAARFQHPNAIVVFDITDHEGDPCLIMEYLQSQSLAMVLSAQGTLPLPQVARIGEQVASALVAAHRAGIVHRDVKPGNVLLGENGTVKITDFGISKAKGDVALTATGLISGTAAYLAPEVARGTDPTPAADVFALGATLFHSLEGEPPYGSNPNPLALLYAAANGQLSEPRNAGQLHDLLLDILSFEPEDRPSMTEIRDQLADFCDMAEDAAPTRMLANHRTAPRRQATRTLDRRAEQAEISTAEMMAQEAPSAPNLPPVRPPRPNGHPTRSHRVPPQPAPERPGNRKPLMIIGGIVVALAIVGGAIYTLFGGTPPPSSASQGASVSTSAAAQSTTSSSSAVGQTKSNGSTDLQAAISAGENFYDDLSGASSLSSAWSLLTPAAQQVYGSEDAFESYWKQNMVTKWKTIGGAHGGSTTANADGSVDILVGSVTSGGTSRAAHLRMITGDSGTPLIDSNTKVNGNA